MFKFQTQLLFRRDITVILLLIILTACSAPLDEPTGIDVPELVHNVTSSETLSTHDDLEAAGFKTSKEYDVRDLTDATSAVFGFWRPDGSDAKEYEIRFYPSHEIAVRSGTSFADEATGDDAILDKDEAAWKEGIKDRRYFFAGPIGTHGSGGVKAKYGGYIIHGNMIMLCEGANPVHSADRCMSLLEAMGILPGQ
ncbi:MAG: hypothetical protein QGH11_01515 [Pirellulaceae bacterium]|jgi:hypothetical protein|nr:hypothetical protein [Arenicellales bacterium]MDP7204219.1 hypothetical protein [Pirellulaceae bacterium]